MQIVPTLNFGGNCREAIHLYEKAFHGKITCLITYGEADDPVYNPLLKEEQKDYIYHSELVLDDHRKTEVKPSIRWRLPLTVPAGSFLPISSASVGAL